MGVYIKGMEMPTCCSLCPCFNDEYYYCQAADMDLGRIPVESRRPNCPLIEVPPHGRLVDADALLVDDHQHYNYIADEFYVEVRTIENAPTVIEASEVE